MNIYRRKDGRWECRCSKKHGNANSGRSFYGKTREEAERKMLLFLNETDNSYSVTDMTVTELVTEWLAVMSSQVKESTYSNYRMKAFKHIIPYFGSRNCCSIKAKDVYSFVQFKTGEGLSARYVADIVVIMKSVYRYAGREYNIKNTLYGVKIPKRAQNEVKVLTPEQQHRLMSYAFDEPDLTKAGIILTLGMGLRIGELCGLQWRDIDLEERVLSVRKTVQRIQTSSPGRKTKLIITEPKSRRSLRRIPIPDALAELLSGFRAEDDCFVLSGSRKPLEPRTMQYRFARMLEKTGLPPVHYHSLRHAFASKAVELGFDIKTLSEILGHHSVKVTLELYVHSSMDRKRSCMDMIKLI